MEDIESNTIATNPPNGPWRAAVDAAVRTFKFGNIIDRAWFVTQFGMTIPDVGTKKVFDKLALEFFEMLTAFRTELLKAHQMALRSIGSGQWEVVLPGEQNDFASTGLANGVSRHIRKARLLVEHTRTSMLTQQESRDRIETIGRIAAFEAIAARAILAPKVEYQEPVKPPREKGARRRRRR